MYQFGNISDNDSSLASTSAGNFGLNTGFVTKFEFGATIGKENKLANHIMVNIKIADKTYNLALFEITGNLYGAGNVQFSPSQPEYAELFKKEMMQREAMVVHIVKALGVAEQQIKTALSVNPTTFEQWARIMTGLKPQNFDVKPVDVFLQYQYKPSEGQTKTFLELPKNMKLKYWIVPQVKPVGTWTEDKSNGLKYIDGAGNIHPIMKDESFFKQACSAQQDTTKTASTSGAAMNTTTGTANWE